MQAITTKYHGPTNFQGSRVTARAEAGRVTVPWDHALNSEGNHKAAAKALATKLGWVGAWVGGGLPDGTGHVYVYADRAHSDGFTISARVAVPNPAPRSEGGAS